MDEKLRHLLITLQENDYKWIASDKDGIVLAYKVKPKKNQNNGWWDSTCYDWIILNDFSNVDLSIFQWKDKSPRSIQRLLSNNNYLRDNTATLPCTV